MKNIKLYNSLTNKIEDFKYNNSLDEKEQRHDNTRKEARITIKIK